MTDGRAPAANPRGWLGEPKNVVEALAAVMRDLPGIGKGGHAAPSQGGYAYRGIEQVTAEVQKLFAKYGIVPVPRVKHRRVEEIFVNDKPWTDTYLEVDWDIYGPGGTQDCLPACTFGHGRDNSDKGTNKAMTQAFKYLLLDMLCISDPADDNDGTNVAADPHVLAVPPARMVTYEQVNGVDIPLDVPMESTRSGPVSDLATSKQVAYIRVLKTQGGYADGDLEVLVNTECPPWPGSLTSLSKSQAAKLIEQMK